MADKVDRAQVLESVVSQFDPWLTEDGRIFLDYFDGGVRKTLTLMPSGNCDFRGWFVSFCVDNYKIVPSGDFTTAAQAYMVFHARRHGKKMKDFIRVGGTIEQVYLDCADSANSCWRIDSDGIERVPNGFSDFRFLRSSGMLPLAEPNLDVAPREVPRILGKFIEADRPTLVLLTAWLVSTLRPEGPYPVLILNGEQGAGKSTLLRMMRRIVDPHALDMRSPPEDQRDLRAMVRNSFVLAFDNVSYISPKLSDALCVISTGTGAQGGRALYTDAEENAVRVCRPIAMNGIPDIVERGDLLDRSIQVHLPKISASRRRDDSEFWNKFNAAVPDILGGLMNAVKVCIQNYGKIPLSEKPRMSAFATWVVGAEEVFGWKPGEFLQYYAQNRAEAESSLLEFNGLASALFRVMENMDEFSGTYADLIAACEMHQGPREKLPSSAHAFAAELRRVRPLLERHGLRFYSGGRSSHKGQKGRSLLSIVKEVR